MNKKLLLIPFLTMIVGSTAGCGGKAISTDDPTKANLHIGTLNKGIGIDWLKNAAAMFEDLYKDSTEFETGKTGVKISINGDTNLDGDYLDKHVLNDDIYFTEQVNYRDLVAKGKLLDITDVLTEDLSAYGDNSGTTIESKIDATMLNYLKVKDKYYGVPFYDAFYGLVYDVNLFNEKALYLAKNGSFVRKNGDLSLGTDGIAGTPDDGLPSTYEEFAKLVKQMTDNGIIPFVTADNGKEYVADYLYNVLADFEGTENFVMNLTLDGTATDLVDNIDEEGNITYKKETIINVENGYELTRQEGRYQAERFFKEVLYSDPVKNVLYVTQHTDAHSRFIDNKDSGKPPIGMIVEASWWENEARDKLDAAKTRRLGEENDYAIMPIPFLNDEKAEACGRKHTYLSLSQSFGVVSKSCSNVKLVKEFLKFLHSDKMLSKFTADTSITRPFNYTVLEEDQAKLSNYAKSLIYLKANSNIVYPYSSIAKEVNYPTYFKHYYFAWKSTVDGADYFHPWDYFRNVSNGTVVAYFNGQYAKYSAAWDKLKV